MDSEAKRRIDSWGLAKPELLARSPTSAVYRVLRDGEPAALKCFTKLGARDEGAGAWALEYFAGRGAVHLLCADAEAQLLEFVPGRNALEEPLEALASTVEKFHGASGVVPAELTPLKKRFASLLYYQGNHELLSAGQRVANTLFALPTPEIVLHGDLHHENLLHHPERGWLAIDPKGLRGERGFDAVNLLYNPISRPERVLTELLRKVEFLVERLTLDRERFISLAFTYGCLSAIWAEEDGKDPWLAIEVATLLKKLT